MDLETRRRIAREALDDYVHGPEAATASTAQALAKTVMARAVILVEGISDKIALETLALRTGLELDEARVVVVPVGGAHAMGRFLAHFGPSGRGLELAGLCDAAEEESLRASLIENGLGDPQSRNEMEDLGFYVCVEDLEDELIRAAGTHRVEALLRSQGDLGSFRTMQNQPAWRERDIDAQLRRYLGSGARRKLRYARLLVRSIEMDQMPRPLNAVLGAV